MSYSNDGKDIALDAIGAAAVYISVHTADPGATGANEVVGGSYARVATTWAAASAAAKSGSAVTLNIPAGTTITHFGLWTAVSGGTYVTGDVLPNSGETYGSAGTYVATPTLNATG